VHNVEVEKSICDVVRRKKNNKAALDHNHNLNNIMTHTPESKALAIIPHVTGTLSVLGSCWILYDVWTRLKRKKSITTYHRILMGMSVYDAVCSFSLGLSTWPMPIGTEGVYAAVGNTQTCTAQG